MLLKDSSFHLFIRSIANIHQMGPNSYQSSEKGRLQVYLFESLVFCLFIKLVIGSSFRRPKCKKEILYWR
jgi:hypothetical protein